MSHILQKSDLSLFMHDVLNSTPSPQILQGFCLFVCSTALAVRLSGRSFLFLPTCLKLIYESFNFLSSSSGLSECLSTKLIISKRNKACQELSTKIITDSSHPIREHGTKNMSFSVARSSYRHFYASIQSFSGFTIQYLARFLKDSDLDALLIKESFE